MSELKIKAKALYKSIRFRMSASDNFLFIGFYKYLYKPKKGSLSEYLSQYSKARKGKFTVVQIGANDGITHDPIHKFIKRDRWKGVLLEPQKAVFDEFLSKIYQKNEGIHVLNAALGDSDGETLLYKIAFSSARWATGLASFDKATILRAFDGHVQRNAEKDEITVPEAENERITAEKIQVISPKTLLKKYEIENIDLLMIDTEGFDFEVIKKFYDAEIRPSLIIYEHSHFSPQTKTTCEIFLRRRGYALQVFGGNTAATFI